MTDFLSSYRILTLCVMIKGTEKEPYFWHVVLPNLPQRSVADLESLIILTGLDQEEAQIDLNDTRYPKLVDVHFSMLVPSSFQIHGGAFKFTSFNSSSLRKFICTKLSMTVIESLDLLSSCPSLEESQLNITQVNGSRMPVSMPQIHLRCLRKLFLHAESAITFSTFIEVLTLPVVEKLHLFYDWSATAFQSLAHRSHYFPHLRNFDLTGTPTAVVDAGALLALMPCLTSIYLPCLSTNDIIFDHIALDSLASGSLAPRLQTLSAGSTSNTGSFLDMVESRMQNAQMSSNRVPAPFTNVVFRPHYLDSSDCLRLQDMQQRGIPIHYRYRRQ
ncbi:hypothetical protein M378DRAFT_811210 [Amanita muscaria Koide BX008]|uniref:Uncharacterized protein n=1 Tax=Amanita muscaria (strain Koide BX008) TaxID=946122 RepID=A0A0C2WZX9_AMAMK|nr:hypothetical protein M378DRAFT_811210 [Amanita muscaria Koide BX008]